MRATRSFFLFFAFQTLSSFHPFLYPSGSWMIPAALFKGQLGPLRSFRSPNVTTNSSSRPLRLNPPLVPPWFVEMPVPDGVLSKASFTPLSAAWATSRFTAPWCHSKTAQLKNSSERKPLSPSFSHHNPPPTPPQKNTTACPDWLSCGSKTTPRPPPTFPCPTWRAWTINRWRSQNRRAHSPLNFFF